MNSKLVLGTVQFGLAYGVNNAQGMPSDDALADILSCAHAEGIRLLDTAFAYGTAEERLGQNDPQRFRFISKFPKVRSATDLTSHFRLSCGRLNCDGLYAYMAHNASTLIESPELWHDLKMLQQNEQTGKLGFSLYHPDELEQLLALSIIPEIVQLPYSLLDRKFEPYFETLKAHGTEIHVRSVFLQGLYFMQPAQLPERLKSLKTTLEALQQIVVSNKLNREAVALQFAAQHPFVDRIVIGVDSVEQLKSNCRQLSENTIDNSVFEAIRELKVADPAYLNPAVWHA